MKKLKKGFTLIELLAVIAILAILVLIAAPSFIGGKDKAQLALIKSDIKTVEQEVGLHLLEYETLNKSKGHPGFTKESPSYGNKEVIYDVRGEFKGNVSEGGELYDVSKLIDSSLNKTGIFIANDKGEAFYVFGATPKNEPSKNGDEDEETQLPETSEKDFVWILSDEWFAYTSPNKGKGYWRYNGNESTVVIPKQLEGENLIRYNGMFINNSTVSKVISDNKNIINMTGMFMGSNVENLDLSELYAKNSLSLNSMLQDSTVKNITFGEKFIDGSVNVAAHSMFRNTKANKIDLSGFDASKVVNMGNMFTESSAEEIILGPKFTGENATNTKGMFWKSNAKKIDLSNFNASKVQDMTAMFKESAADEIILGPKFTGENVTNTTDMFWKSNAKKIDLSNFNASKVEEMIAMFRDTAAEEIILGPKFTGENAKTTNAMFWNSKAKKIDLSNFNASKVEDMIRMFDGSSADEIILGPKFTGENAKITNSMFLNSKAKKIDLSNFNSSKVEDMISMFAGSSADEIILGPKFTGENAKTTNSMFWNSKAKKIDLSNFNASKVEDMISMFAGSSAEEIILGPKFTGENVISTNSMFKDSNVPILDLSSLDLTKKVGENYKAKVDFMFQGSKQNTVYMNSASIARMKQYSSTKHINFIAK